jgi:hypothetical protein
MRWRRHSGLALLALLVVGWVALAMGSGGGPGGPELSKAGFDKSVEEAASGVLSAVRTAHLTGQADVDGRVTRSFVTSALTDTMQGVADAQRQLSETPPPSHAQAATRDELLRLLGDATRATGDLLAAADRDDKVAVRAAVGALGPIGDRLAGFVERHRS